LGRTTAVNGSVVDIAFVGGMLPAITDAVAIDWDVLLWLCSDEFLSFQKASAASILPGGL